MKKIKFLIQRKLFFKNKIEKYSIEINFKRENIFLDNEDKLYRRKIVNEVFYDTEWWQQKVAIEWWNRNGHFNDSLYRDILLEKIDRDISLSQNQIG